MRAILWRIQRAYLHRNLRAGSRATSVAVRYRRRVHAHVHFAAGFHIKTLPDWADRATERSLAKPSGVWRQNPCGGTRCACFRDCARVFWGGWLFVFLRESVFGGLCYNFFGKQGDKMRQKKFTMNYGDTL